MCPLDLMGMSLDITCSCENSDSFLILFSFAALLAGAVGVRNPNEWPKYNTKQFDGEVLTMLELWEMQSTPSLPLFPGSLWPRAVALDWVLSVDQIELFDI